MHSVTSSGTHPLCARLRVRWQVSSLQQFVAACNASPSGSLNTTNLSSASITPTPSPLDAVMKGSSPLSSGGSGSSLSSAGSPLSDSPLTDSSIPGITADLEQIISILYGDSGEGASQHKEPDPKQAKESTAHRTALHCTALHYSARAALPRTDCPVCVFGVRMVELLVECDVYSGLFAHIRCVEFEGRKYFTRVCEYSISQRPELLEPYIESRPLLLEQLVAAYDEKDVSVALCGDAILRACLMRESICETWFNHRPSLVQPFFKYVELPNFDISAHAFETLKVHRTHTDHRPSACSRGGLTRR